MKIYKLLLLFCFIGFQVNAQPLKHNSSGTGNPILPGYFADPTIKKFGDTWYIYSTTDGNNDGRGPATVWTSKDFVNWTMHEMNWPITKGGYYWAPDVTIGDDGKYRLFYNIPCESFEGIGDSPKGPWKNILGEDKTLIQNYLVPDIITLDAQTFKDDDGKFYILFGTWGIYPRSGCGIGLLNSDLKTFAKLDKIPNTQAIDFFEAPFLLKKDGIYYLTYSSGSCHDSTYRVQYAVSKTSPFGPYEMGKNNPILETSKDGSIHGPGHHSIIQEGSDYYIVYHRHDNPHSARGMHRQICADKLIFGKDGSIEKVLPTHEGIGFLAKNTNPYPNLCFEKRVKVSSYYNEDFKPEYAVDDNNGTMWKAADNYNSTWLEIDLGKAENIKRTRAEFLFPTMYYQYLIEYSEDEKNWKIFADRRSNQLAGSPMTDYGDVQARYLRITITNIEKPGMFAGLWNFKAYSSGKDEIPQILTTKKDVPPPHPQGLLVDLDARTFGNEQSNIWKNSGILGGNFKANLGVNVGLVDGIQSLIFTGKESFTSSFLAPLTLSGNSSFTVAYWVNNPKIDDEEYVVGFAPRGGADATAANFGYGSNKEWGVAAHWGWADIPFKDSVPQASKWHHVAITFDGYVEKIFVDGKLNCKKQRMLYLAAGDSIHIASAADNFMPFSGALASVKIYDIPLTDKEIENLANENRKSDILVSMTTEKLNYGKEDRWKNNGSLASNFLKKINSVEVKDVNGKFVVQFKESPLRMNVNDSLLDDFTIEGAFFISKSSKNETFFCLASNTGYFLNLNTISSKNEGIISLSSSKKITSKYKIKQEEWQHFVLNFSKYGIVYFINGEEVAKITNTFSSNIKEIVLGGNSENKNLFSGAISFLKIQKKSIKPEEVASLYEIWNNANKNFTGKKIEFLENPKAITQNIIEMKAKEIEGFSQYIFIDKTTGESSGWSEKTEFLHEGLKPESEHEYILKAKDINGNVISSEIPYKTNTFSANFAILEDNFSAKKDFLKESIINTIWDGFIAKGKNETADELSSENGILTMKSNNSKWNGELPRGPFLYKNILGDFVVEVVVEEVSGQKEKRAVGPNDCGLMVRVADSTQAGEGEDLLQVSVFPGWNMGNMFTNLNGLDRPQQPNNSGWNFNKYLQIQRKGNVFHARTSADGLHWTELKGSPVVRNDMNGLPLQVGIFQCTYRDQQAWGKYSKFRIYK